MGGSPRNRNRSSSLTARPRSAAPTVNIPEMIKAERISESKRIKEGAANKKRGSLKSEGSETASQERRESAS